jgi:hypothetical protein
MTRSPGLVVRAEGSFPRSSGFESRWMDVNEAITYAMKRKRIKWGI